ncbi:hypothetical protein ACWENQ_44815 [Nonomuraea sp. NPDC004354]
MISFFFVLGLVVLVGGGIASHVHRNPSTTTQRKRAQKRTAGEPSASSGRAREWAVASYRWVMTRPDRLRAAQKEAHTKAKKEGRTAATRVMSVITERRGWREALGDIKESLGRGRGSAEGEQAEGEQGGEAEQGAPEPRPSPSPAPDPEPTPDPGPEPAPDTSTDTAGGTMSDTTTSTSSPSPAGPSLITLFEISDQMAKLPFESLLQIKQFTTYLGMGCQSISRMYVTLAERMAGPMSIDRIVTEHIERCGAHQRAVHGAIGEAETSLTVLFNSTPAELLARGIRVPRAELLNGAPSTLGRALVPMFYETASTLSARPFEDLRGVHALIKALGEASTGQHALYRRMAARMGELRVAAGVPDAYFKAARQQGAITSALADADTAMGRLLNMTLLELAQSNVRAPEVHLTGV